MGRRGLRTLVLVVSLPLVLPPGWCGWLVSQAQPKVAPHAPATGTLPAQSAGLCCCHTHQAEPQQLPEGGGPKEPRTPPLDHCPCSDRQTTPPTISTVEPDAGGFTFAFVAPLRESASPTVGVTESAPAARPPARPLHVLNCVWRC